jgi:hypothetical protein
MRLAARIQRLPEFERGSFSLGEERDRLRGYE